MKLVIDVEDDAARFFPVTSEWCKNCVDFEAKRIGPRKVRWTLTGAPRALAKYKKIAKRNSLPYRTDGRAIKVYLATPYTGREEDSFVHANKVAGELIAAGLLVYSPISHSHPIAQATRGLPTDWGYWKEVDTSFINWAECVVVMCREGWLESTGVQAEIRIAGRLGKPVINMLPADTLAAVLESVRAVE